MWIDRRGSNYTAQQVCDFLHRAAGNRYTPETLHAAYGVGRIYHNGGIWFQRLS